MAALYCAGVSLAKTFVFVTDCVFSLVERFGYQMLCGQNSESQACRIRLFFSCKSIRKYDLYIAL